MYTHTHENTYIHIYIGMVSWFDLCVDIECECNIYIYLYTYICIYMYT
jgi:hypothetical protein